MNKIDIPLSMHSEEVGASYIMFLALQGLYIFGKCYRETKLHGIL